ncbi:ABC transporter substrate-binding protein [Ferribacterium limneticum]|uniref:ABC transporter substrate-binding protein n=1 Tax=Ferribacterium limneticum TaxID=76259 RepID=UPI001CFAF569|nr:ABC transporter substrate-binding protein [Ferribacterium limneticum]UCV29052.1 ABC transporter substrate-binding protein [Ferribacterium limneticum]UCV32970.1 ABC transporter substrate-binding protein [Ferribacterium limneticum]
MVCRKISSLALLLLASTFALADIRIGVIASSTGPTAVVGIPQKNTVGLLPTEIGGQKVEYIVLDDASDPTNAVTGVKKLISEYKVDALIGPTTTPAALAMLDFVAESRVPLVTTVGSSSIILPLDDKRRWVFKTTQNDDLIAGALLEHMTAAGTKTVGFIGFNDPYGENWFKVFSAMAEKAGLKIIASERFNRTDQSVTGQALKVMTSKPDAVLIAATGGPAVLPQTTLQEKGYKGRIYQTHGVATNDFIRIGGKAVEGTLMAGGPMLVAGDLVANNPIKAVAQGYIKAYEGKYGAGTMSTFGANTYDAGLLLQKAIPEALKKAKPGSVEFRAALRDALEQSKEVVGAQGVFNMTAQNHNGMDQRARVMMTVRDGKWVLLKE